MSAFEHDINCNLGVLHLSTWVGGGTVWDKHRRLRQPCLSERGDLQVGRDKLWRKHKTLCQSWNLFQGPNRRIQLLVCIRVERSVIFYWLNDLCHSHFDTSMDLYETPLGQYCQEPPLPAPTLHRSPFSDHCSLCQVSSSVWYVRKARMNSGHVFFFITSVWTKNKP